VAHACPTPQPRVDNPWLGLDPRLSHAVSTACIRRLDFFHGVAAPRPRRGLGVVESRRGHGGGVAEAWNGAAGGMQTAARRGVFEADPRRGLSYIQPRACRHICKRRAGAPCASPALPGHPLRGRLGARAVGKGCSCGQGGQRARRDAAAARAVPPRFSSWLGSDQHVRPRCWSRCGWETLQQARAERA
jgi:hypothetical protein